MGSNKPIRTTSWAAQVLAAMAVAVVVLVGLVHPAVAKGPSSATLSGPGIDPPIDLTQTADPGLMHAVMQQTGLWFGAGEAVPQEPAAADLGPRYTLSWVNSGPPSLSEEERTIDQYIYAHANLGLVIHTPEQNGLSGWGRSVTGWFVAPIGLQPTLTELGIEIQSEHEPTSAVADSDIASPPSHQAAAVAAAAPQPGDPAGTASTQNTSSTSAVHLSVIGVVVVAIGLAGTVGARRVLRPASRGRRIKWTKSGGFV